MPHSLGKRNKEPDAHDLRVLINSVPAPSGAFDHGALTGLADDDHSQYVHISAARSIAAQHSFAPAAPNAPFTLTANAQGQTVVGFKADQLNKQVTAGNGLTGGGALTADVTLNVGAGTLISVAADSVGLSNGSAQYQVPLTGANPYTPAWTTASDNPGSTEGIPLRSGASGYLTLVRLNTDVIADKSGGNLTISPAGDVTFDPTGNDILPNVNYDLNLGAINKKYLTLHCAELWVETLVAQNTIATIGGRILVGPTTTLTSDINNVQQSINVKHNEMAINDIVYMEADGKVEFMQVTAGPTGAGPYTYTVTRNLDGTGGNEWYAGDAMFNTGVATEGFIDLYSIHGIKSGTNYGPTIVGNVRISLTYNGWIEHWAIGNLNGLYGYGANKYGAAFGRYENGYSFITIDDADGIQMRKRSGGANTTVAQWKIDGELILGEIATGKSTIALGGTYGLGLRIYDGAAHVVKIRLEADGDIFLGTDINAGASGRHFAIFSNAQTYNGESVGVGDVLLGDNTVASGKANMFWDLSAGELLFRGGQNMQVKIGTSGAIVAGAGAVTIDSTGIAINQGNGDVNAVRWKDGSTVMSKVYGYYNASYNNLYLTVPEVAARHTYIHLDSYAPTTYYGKVGLGAYSGSRYINVDAWVISSSAARLEITGGTGDANLLVRDSIAMGNNATVANVGNFVIDHTDTISGNVTDDYSAAIGLTPRYLGAFTVTRHNYIDLVNPVLGSTTLTDACVFRFGAAAGTHKAIDTGTTKTTPGGVNAWMKININGTIYYIPAYTSKTA